MPVDTEAIKQRHPIADVIAAHGVRLRPSGRRFMALCPFHKDNRPSFVVYPDTRTFNCFGCGAMGDVIDFVRRTRDVGFREAVAYLGELPPGEASAPPPAPRKVRPLTVDDRLILTAAVALYHESLMRTPHALQYLESRHIPRWLVRRARLGYSDGRLLESYLKRRRLSLRRAVAMGLLYRDPHRSDVMREAMRERIVIPDLRPGHCAWMTGRSLREDARVPYLDLALPKPLLGYEEVRGHERIVVTEGPFDWLTALSWGIPACSTLGTHPSARALRALDRARSIVLAFDRDGPGIRAADALVQALGERPRVLTLPDGVKDLNDLAKQEDGRETFERLLAELEAEVADVA